MVGDIKSLDAGFSDDMPRFLRTNSKLPSNDLLAGVQMELCHHICERNFVYVVRQNCAQKSGPKNVVVDSVLAGIWHWQYKKQQQQVARVGQITN